MQYQMTHRGVHPDFVFYDYHLCIWGNGGDKLRNEFEFEFISSQKKKEKERQTFFKTMSLRLAAG